MKISNIPLSMLNSICKWYTGIMQMKLAFMTNEEVFSERNIKRTVGEDARLELGFHFPMMRGWNWDFTFPL